MRKVETLVAANNTYPPVQYKFKKHLLEPLLFASQKRLNRDKRKKKGGAFLAVRKMYSLLTMDVTKLHTPAHRIERNHRKDKNN